jgi:ABC-2 type transport system permease protein
VTSITSTASAVPPDALVEEVPGLTVTQSAASYLETVSAMAQAELHKVWREPSVLIARCAQPLLWLLVFGAAVSRVPGLGSEGVPYKSFLVPGVIAQSVLFVAIFSGLAIIWERDLGITQRVLVAPVSRSAIILGKAVSAATRAMFQVGIVLAVVALVRIPLLWSPLRLAAALLAAALGATLLSAISMVIASAVRSREQFMGIGQLVTLPLLFASNALYSVSVMPGWLRAVAQANPLTYEVELLRQLLVGVGPDRMLFDVVVLVAWTIVAVAIASRTFPRRVI